MSNGLYNQIHNKEPGFDVLGDVVHIVKVQRFEIRDTKIRTLVTSVEKRQFDKVIHMYYNGDLIGTKRINKEKATLYESFNYLDAIAMDFQLGVRD